MNKSKIVGHVMKLYSTRKNSPIVSFKEALFKGQAPDGGLYMPQELPCFEPDTLSALAGKSYPEVALIILQRMVGDEFGRNGLQSVVEKAYDFEPKLNEIADDVHVLELYHGPTLSFKDFGAQFMAKSMGHFLQQESREITILVATSGDTGSAVAHAYHNVEGIRVVLLYPDGKVSPLQEAQFTTLGDNVSALKVDGTFDDCQALVKIAFRDCELYDKAKLSSANSINIGRLIPQSLYYFWSVLNVRAKYDRDVLVCVPSGNFGNICAGMFACKMGLPVEHFIAAVNSNSVISEYVETGEYRPRPSVRTLSNAMDVGAPSNWERIQDLYIHSYKETLKHLWSCSVDDAVTIDTMKKVYARSSYIADPHTAVGLKAIENYRNLFPRKKNTPVVSLSTAHPAKFIETVDSALDIKLPIPKKLADCAEKTKQVESMPNSFSEFKSYLWEL